MSKHVKVKAHRGVKVHPAHTVRGVHHHKDMDHYPSSNAGSKISTTEPYAPGSPMESPAGGSMPGGMPTPMDGDSSPMGGGY